MKRILWFFPLAFTISCHYEGTNIGNGLKNDKEEETAPNKQPVVQDDSLAPPSSESGEYEPAENRNEMSDMDQDTEAEMDRILTYLTVACGSPLSQASGQYQSLDNQHSFKVNEEGDRMNLIYGQKIISYATKPTTEHPYKITLEKPASSLTCGNQTTSDNGWRKVEFTSKGYVSWHFANDRVNEIHIVDEGGHRIEFRAED